MTDQLPLTLDDEGRLDELVPPPWSRQRRTFALVVALGVAAGVLAIVLSGAVGPRLKHESGWGAGVTRLDGQQRITVERQAPIRNTGWLPVTVETLDFPDLDGVTWGEVPGLPVRLGPGETHELIVPFTVTGCDIDVAGYDVLPIRATSGIAPSRIVEVAPPASDPWSGPTTFRDDDGDETLVPGFPEQPPSWIIDTVADVCLAPPTGGF